MGENVLLAVGSDHGMETVKAQIPVARLLVEAGLKERPDSQDVVLAPNGSAFVLGVAIEAQSRIPAIAAFLREQDWCEAVYHGSELATLGLPVGDPCCAIAVDMAHDARANDHGVEGSTCIAENPDDSKDYLGCGQHGGLGRYEQSPFLAFDGGGFAQRRKTPYPASLIDIAPTLMRHLGLPDSGMDGSALPLDPPALGDRPATSTFQ